MMIKLVILYFLIGLGFAVVTNMILHKKFVERYSEEIKEEGRVAWNIFCLVSAVIFWPELMIVGIRGFIIGCKNAKEKTK